MRFFVYLRLPAAVALVTAILSISSPGIGSLAARIPSRMGPQVELSNTSYATSELAGILGAKTAGQTRPADPYVAASLRPASDAACSGAPAYDWLHTSGPWIEDTNDCHVRLVSVDWYGMDTTNFVPAGLDFQSYKTILAEIKRLGFNSIRFSISEQMVRYNSKLHVGKKYIKKDPELKGLHPLQVLDRIVAEAHRLGLFLILDNHSSVAGYAANVPHRGALESVLRKGLGPGLGDTGYPVQR